MQALHSSRVAAAAARNTSALRTSVRAMATSQAAAPVDVKKTYDTVCGKLKEISALSGIDSLLYWDQMVMMPPGGSTSRSAQKSALTGVLHDKRTDKELGGLLQVLHDAVAAGGGEELDAHAKAVVRIACKDYHRTTAIPKELAQRAAVLETEGYMAWVEARKASDWAKFEPYLQQWIDLRLEKAKCIDPTADPYDVLLEDYEKGMTSQRLDEIFSEVRDGLVPLIAAIKAKGANSNTFACLRGDFDIDTQDKMCKKVSADLCFDFENGRQDVSVHPFSIALHPKDVRMTTRFKADNILEGVSGAIHETGHALYEQGRDLSHDGLPVSEHLSMGVHESQSLLWERMVALSRPFAAYLLPRFKEFFPSAFESVTVDQLYAAENVVKDPSYIRVESDEVTYPMHIILRYEIERGLLAGTIKVSDVPKVWAQKMESYLGVVPPDDAQGCLQDVHWSSGAFGYFPTYSLGAMYATQIFQAAGRAIPGLDEQIARGEFKALKAWLNEHIHKFGSLPPSGDDLMVAATGSKLQPSIFLTYLKDKYSKLYDLKL